MKSLRIVHTESSLNLGGQELRTLVEMEWMMARGHDCLLIAPEESGIAREAEIRGLPLQTMPFTGAARYRSFLDLLRLFSRWKPEIVASHSGRDSVPAQVAARLCRVPCILRYRHISLPIKPRFGNRLAYRHLCHHVVTTANRISQFVVEASGAAPEKVSVIATGIDVDVPLPEPDVARRKLQEELGLGAGARFIGSMTFLRGDKGIQVLLDAFDRIAGGLENWHLIIPGTGPSEEKLKAQGRQLAHADRVHFIGLRTPPQDVLRAYELLVQPSLSNEGIPQSVLQAFGCGVPVVGTDVGGIPEVLDLENGCRLVVPGDADQLGEAMVEVLNRPDDRPLQAEALRKKARELYSLDAMGEKTLDLYRRYLPEGDA
jgi:glycosyltransferase involved in cell wall biosynthesis